MTADTPDPRPVSQPDHRPERGLNPTPPDLFIRCTHCNRPLVRVEPANSEAYWRHWSPRRPQ